MPSTIDRSTAAGGVSIPSFVMASREEGQRLKAFVSARWGREQGGLRGLARRAGLSTQSFYGWFRGAWDPDLASLTEVAKVLGVKRSELVAAMDGDLVALPLDGVSRQAIREVLEELLAERLGGLVTPQRRLAR